MDERNIRVRVTGYQRVRYSQVKCMTAKEWAEIEQAYADEDDDKIDALAEHWIDFSDVDDADSLEDTELELVPENSD